MSAEAIARVRTMFENDLKTNGADRYHPIDVERVRTEEWQVKRYIIDEPDANEEKAFAAMCRALQWKKSFGVHDRTDQYFPKEIWELNNVEIYGKTNNGTLVQWEAIRNQRTFPETLLLAQQFIAHCLERVDRAAGETGFILVTDSNGAGLSNVDMEISRFKIAAIDYYPQGLKGLYIVDLPWLLNAVMKIVIGLMSEKLKKMVNYVKAPELLKIIDAQYVPVELGGKRDKHAYPSDLVPFDQATALGYDEKFYEKFYKTFKLERTTKA